MRLNDVRLALMLGYNNIPFEFYQNYADNLHEERIKGVEIKNVNPDIFLNTIIKKSLIPLNEEKIIKALEEAELYTPLTDKWRNDKAIIKDSLSDEAMTVESQIHQTSELFKIKKEVVELALVLAYSRLPYDIYT